MVEVRLTETTINRLLPTVRVTQRVLMYGNKNNKVKSKDMKKFTLFIAMTLIALFGVKTTISAQQTEEQIEWIKYAITIDDAISKYGSSTDGIYLCHWDGGTKYTFVNAGGDYGTQAVVTNRGIRLTATGENTAFRLKATLYNPSEGVYLGIEPDGHGSYTDRVFLDRGTDYYSSWRTSSPTLVDGHYYYSIRCNGNNKYLSINTEDNTLQMVSNSSGTDRWLFIPRDAFRAVLLSVTHQTNIEVSGLFQNTRFVRYMDMNSSWEWWTIDENNLPGTKLSEDKVGSNVSDGNGLGIAAYGAYRSMAPGAENIKNVKVLDHDGKTEITLDYAKSYGNFSAAEMKNKIVMRQQIKGVRPGTYTITAQAFVSDDAGDIKGANNIAFLFAAGTSGINQSAEIPVLASNEQSNFTTNFYNYHKNTLTASQSKYFRGNVAAGEFLATAGDYNNSSEAINKPNTIFKTITLSVTVTAESNSQDKTGTLTIGAAKYSNSGTLYIDNIRVFYSGEYEFGIDSYSENNKSLTEENTGGIDEFQYGYARQFNLVRDFGDTTGDKVKSPKWEAIVLPVNLTATQVRNTFGNDVMLSEFYGLANGGRQLRFNTVDLTSNPDAIAIKAGGCYVIKVTKAPEVARTEKYTFNVYNGTGNLQIPITYYGPVYQIDGVTRESTLEDLITENKTGTYSNGTVTKEYTTNDGTLKFTGYFYWNQTPPTNAYVVSRGKMFYLNSESTWKNLTGTMWKLEDSTGEAKEFSVDFGDGTITNGISDITADGENTNVTGVYNLNGQKVSDGTTTDNLPKGIYIVNGKKYVVR